MPTKNEISLEKVSGGQKQLALIHTNYYSIDVIPKLYSMAWRIKIFYTILVPVVSISASLIFCLFVLVVS